LLSDFNLVVSTSRGNERNACSELWYLLGEVGDRGSTIDSTAVIGLIVGKTKLEPIKTIHDLRALFKERPWEFKYALKIVPVQKVIPADLPGIQKTAVELAGGIRENEKFRITIEKRHTDLQSKEIIDQVAKRIERKVNLDTPDKIVLVEIIGQLAGLSLITSNDVLSVEREKRAQ
jgi:tRNA acetyltransferase TAN1